MIGPLLLLGLSAAIQGVEPGAISFEQLDRTFRENLEAIPDLGLIRFSHRYHQNPVVRAGAITPEPGTPNEDTGLFAFDGPSAYFEQSAPPEVLFARFFSPDEDERWPGPPTLVRGLTDGRSTLLNRRIPGSAPAFGDPSSGGSGGGPELLPGNDELLDHVFLPLIHGPGPARLADVTARSGMVPDGGGDARVISLDPDATLDGLPVVDVTLEVPNGLLRLWIDPSRGAIPVRVRDERARPPVLTRDGRVVSEGRLSVTRIDFQDIRQVPGDSWLPFLEVVSTSESLDGSAPPEPFRTTTITEAVLGESPDRSLFRLEYSGPVSPWIRAGSGPPGPARRVWDLDAMAGLDPKPPPEPIPPDELGNRAGRLDLPGIGPLGPIDAIAILSGVGLVAAVAFRFSRRRTSRSRPEPEPELDLESRRNGDRPPG